jgi:hypothetical protein
MVHVKIAALLGKSNQRPVAPVGIEATVEHLANITQPRRRSSHR